MPEPAAEAVPLRTIALNWTRIGLIGFGGPPTHIALLRRLVVDERRWIDRASSRTRSRPATCCPDRRPPSLRSSWPDRVAGPAGAIVGGLGFIVPAVVLMVLLSIVFARASRRPCGCAGPAAGAGAAVAAVAVRAGVGPRRAELGRGSRQAGERGGSRTCCSAARPAALVGRYLVLVLLGCGLLELGIARGWRRARLHGWTPAIAPAAAAALAGAGGLGAVAWVAFKVGALSYGGGFVIIPLMQGDAVHTYHWMTYRSFSTRSRSGRSRPVRSSRRSPRSATRRTASAAARSRRWWRSAVVRFVLDRRAATSSALRTSPRAQAFLDGAGPAAIGAIFGAAIPLAAALRETWQFVVLGAAAVALLLLRRGIVATLVGAAIVGAVLGLAGAPVPR